MTVAYYLIVAFSFFLSFLFLKINYRTFHRLAENSLGLLNEILSKDEEDEKIDLVQGKTNKLLVNLLKVLGLIITSILIICVAIYIYALILRIKYDQIDLSSFFFIISISVGATIPFLIPSKKDNSGYSTLAQLFHRLILDNNNLSLKLFNRDVKKINRRGVSKRKDFIIISGLARSGTTSLMTSLSEIKELKSLNYASMPLILSPIFWRKFYNPKKVKLKERSHKDGLSIGLDTVEALEEHFFIAKAKSSYIFDKTLSKHEISKDVYDDYLSYQQIVRENESSIYLAKNNNFILRYKSIRKLNNEFLMVILFRDPLSHAHSLLSQHKKFCKLQNESPFIEEYMNWLGHHEFGNNQKQFVFNTVDEIIKGDKFTLDYWLKIWCNYYSYLLILDKGKLVIIDYKDYCETPSVVINEIISKLDVDSELIKNEGFSNHRKCEERYSEELYNKSIDIYNKLIKLTNQ